MNLFFTPCAALWYQAWRRHVASARAAQLNYGYCLAAQLANMEYVCALALKK